MLHYETIQFVPPRRLQMLLNHFPLFWCFMKLFTKATLFASHHIGGGLPQTRLWPCEVWTLHSLLLFVCPRPLASSGLRLLPGLSSSGTSSFGVLPPICTTLQELWYRSTLVCIATAINIISLTVTAVVRSVYSFFWSIAFHILIASPLMMRTVCLEWITCCLISAFSQSKPYSGSLSPYLRGQQHLPSLLLHIVLDSCQTVAIVLSQWLALQVPCYYLFQFFLSSA